MGMERAVCSVVCVWSACVCECVLLVVQSMFISVRVSTLFLRSLYSASLVKVVVLEFKVQIVLLTRRTYLSRVRPPPSFVFLFFFFLFLFFIK